MRLTIIEIVTVLNDFCAELKDLNIIFQPKMLKCRHKKKFYFSIYLFDIIRYFSTLN